ncbi:suppressor of cytokine signaling 4-like isoform X1 [Neodiprion virginianus]|uniref:Suppressor of cytokine signaling 4 isoform X1 n=1 Tax=Neodiprion lecontei TaxID=441921 RepID=A0A6J0BL41_NEOLC|nr:suppressor of cytokine signaling 4 isoform X1 [Neodiprion lecontei]XP_046603217.1 suppressor of cytokine signaling 4-like isoform X1 [Neodiprion virginianus]
MAASGSTVCDEKKKIRMMSLTYLRNAFQKKSEHSGCVEIASLENEKNLERIECRNIPNDDLRAERVKFSAHSRPIQSYQDMEYKEIINDNTSGLFRRLKKRLHIRDLTFCKSKQKIKAIEPSSPSYGLNSTLNVTQSQLPIIFFNEKKNSLSNVVHNLTNEANGYLNGTPNQSQSDSIDGEDRLQEEPEYISSAIGNTAEPQASCSAKSGDVSLDIEGKNEKKFNLTEELLRLSKYGWYWGPISRDEADSKLTNEPDGAFLVRDSSADKYLLTLSFKSSGKLLHTRVEHSGGLFSLYYHPECERFSSVVALINHSMSFSQSAVYCYSRPRYPGHPAFPVRLTKPVSRFTQVRSLQYLCRFVIRQNTRVDNIDKLPLPETIRGYIEEAHY